MSSKKTLPEMRNASVKKNGSYRNGRQRWYCLSCRKSYSWKNPVRRLNNEFTWFKKWIVEGFSVRQLQDLSGLDKKRIQNIIHYWLDHPPKPTEAEFSPIQHIIFDGSYLHGRRGIVTLMDARQHRVFAIAYGVSERSWPQLEAFFQQQKDKGLNPSSCTLDGNPRAIKAIKNTWPSILIQRCLVHIQRQGLMWCRMNPKRLDAKRLRDLFLQVTNLSSVQEKNSFLDHFQVWEKKYGVKFTHIKGTGWVLSDLIRARSMLLKAIPNMFHFLEDPTIPKTTNGLEGYFSRLKHFYRQHRGLNPHHRQSYFLWFSHLRQR